MILRSTVCIHWIVQHQNNVGCWIIVHDHMKQPALTIAIPIIIHYIYIYILLTKQISRLGIETYKSHKLHRRRKMPQLHQVL